MNNKKVFLLLFFSFSCALIYSQTLTENYTDSVSTIKMLKLNDGTTLLGEYMGSNDSAITIHTNSLGTLNISTDQIDHIKDLKYSRVKNGDHWFENAGSNYYMIAPSAFPLGKGNFYYRNLYVLINTFGYGVTDYFSITAGFDTYTLLRRSELERDEFGLLIFPQFNFSLAEKTSIGAGFLYAKLTNFSLDESLGAPLINFAYGNEDRNIGLCVGYNVFDSDVSIKRPVIILNGIYRVTNRIAFDAELYRWPINDYRLYIINYGVKFIARKMSVDFGFMKNTMLSDLTILGIPFVSFTVRT